MLFKGCTALRVKQPHVLLQQEPAAHIHLLLLSHKLGHRAFQIGRALRRADMPVARCGVRGMFGPLC